MAFEIKYFGRIPSRGRYWFVQLLRNGFTGDPRRYGVSLDTSIEWGLNKIDNVLDRRVIASSLSLKFHDPKSLIFSELNDPLTDLSDYRIRIEDSTCTYRWTGFPKLTTTFHPTTLTQRRPETRLKAYCKLVDMKDEDAVLTSNVTFHDLVKLLVVDGLIEQPIEYAYGWSNKVHDSSSAIPDKLQIADTTLFYEKPAEEEGRPPKAYTKEKQLTDLMLYMDSQIFQTLRGRWRVGQRFLNGLTLPLLSRAGSVYDDGLDTITEVELPGDVVLAPETEGSEYTLTDPVARFDWVRGYDDKLDGLDDLDFIREGDFQSGGSPWWETISGTYSSAVQGIKLDPNGTVIGQPTLHVAKDTELYIAVDFNYGMEYTPAGAGNHKVQVAILAIPFDPDEDTYYVTGLAGSRTWTTTPSTIEPSLAITPDANGSGPTYTVHNFLGVIEGELFPVNGYIEFRIEGDAGNDFYLVCDDFIGKVQIAAGNPLERFESSFIFSETGITKNYEINIVDTRYHDDPTRGAIDAILAETVLLGFTALSRWVAIEYESEEFSDALELVSRSLRDQADRKIRILRTLVPQIVEPSSLIRFKGVDYTPIYIKLTLHTEVSFVLAIENLKLLTI